jgi:hypothetical protein
MCDFIVGPCLDVGCRLCLYVRVDPFVVFSSPSSDDPGWDFSFPAMLDFSVDPCLDFS